MPNTHSQTCCSRFSSMINPAVTSNFWFTKSSGKLEEGKTISWEWETYGASANVFVNKIIENEFISIQWSDSKEVVDFIFKPTTAGDATYVIINNYGFSQMGDELIDKIIDVTGGFTTVLNGMKAWLEKGFNLNLIADKFPKEFIQHSK